jgi:hypothetical protein
MKNSDQKRRWSALAQELMQAPLPSPTELAQVAAAMDKDQSVASGEPIRLADDALDLWLACRDALVARVSGRRASLPSPEWNGGSETYPAVIPPPATYFPMKLAEFLRRAFPKLKTIADREARFRAYLRESIRVDRAVQRKYREEISETAALKAEPRLQIGDEAEIFQQYKHQGISEDEYPRQYQMVTQWHKRKQRETASEKGKRAAGRRWK